MPLTRPRFQGLPHPTRPRLAALCLIAIMLLVPACSNSHTDTEKTCPAKPAPAAFQGLAVNLPIPKGAYIAGEDTSGPKTSYRRVRIVMTGSIDEFFTFAKAAWPAVGYRLLLGEHDKHDAEAGFLYPDGTSGALKLIAYPCAQPWTP